MEEIEKKKKEKRKEKYKKKMEEWERITKKEFINELSNRENALLGLWMNKKKR